MDPAFLYYSHGILDYRNCCTVLNHALLLVGYGTDGRTGLDYWIAMNRYESMYTFKYACLLMKVGHFVCMYVCSMYVFLLIQHYLFGRLLRCVQDLKYMYVCMYVRAVCYYKIYVCMFTYSKSS